MNVLILFDTVFGNTGKIAQAMGDAMQSKAFVKVVNAGEFAPEQLKETNLLIIGSPTRGFRPTPAISDLLKSLPAASLQGINAAAFDTRMDLNEISSGVFRFIVKTGGFAAKRIAAEMKKKGAELITEPEGFFVTGDQGKDMVAGEPERAGQWGTGLLPTE